MAFGFGQTTGPAHIPLLLRGQVYSVVLRPGLEKRGALILQDTWLGGWVVSGGTGFDQPKLTKR